MIQILDSNSVKVCCGGNGCPIIQDLGDGRVKIIDDEKNEITVKKEELEQFASAAELLISIKESGGSNDQQLLFG